MFINVDLPEPDGPMTETNSPASAEKSTPRSARTTTASSCGGILSVDGAPPLDAESVFDVLPPFFFAACLLSIRYSRFIPRSSITGIKLSPSE
jgi:hypothetical protein